VEARLALVQHLGSKKYEARFNTALSRKPHPPLFDLWIDDLATGGSATVLTRSRTPAHHLLCPRLPGGRLFTSWHHPI